MPIVKGFPRFQSNILSSRRAVTEIFNLVPGSNVQQSGRSSAAPFTSKRPIRKKVTSDDRKAMLESFVNKHRAMNLGKFPTPTSALKEVGGSYYSIRKMLQEMEYNSKISSAEKGPVKENKKATKCKDPIKSSGSKDARLDASGNFDTNVKFNEGLQPSRSSGDAENVNVTKDDTRNIATKSHDKQTHIAKDESPSEDNSEPKIEQYDTIRNITRDMPESQKDDEVREKPSIWGNLKSLATGFINFWKKN